MQLTNRQQDQVNRQILAYEEQAGVDTITVQINDGEFTLEVPPLVANPKIMNSGLQVVKFLADRPGMVEGKFVTDMGTGSGIIGIATAILGARVVYGFDIDQSAVECANQNSQKNGVSNYVAVQSNLFVALSNEYIYSPTRPHIGMDVNIFNHPFFGGDPLVDKPWTRVMLGGTDLLGDYFRRAPKYSKPDALYILPWLPLAGNEHGFDNDPGKTAVAYGYEVREVVESQPVEEGLQREPFLIYVLGLKV